MVNLADYTLQKSETSFCMCGHHIHWLVPHEDVFNVKLELKQFMLCEKCGIILQAGQAEPVSPPEPCRTPQQK
jgi:hypothetical protein